MTATIELAHEVIDEMPAGREMDVLVAEKIMGWTNLHFVEGGYGYKRPFTPTDWYGEGPDKKVFLTSKFSTDIEAAWEVLEKAASLASQFQKQHWRSNEYQ